MSEYKYFTLREKPELKDVAADCFHKKWGVPTEAYLECMTDYLDKNTENGWYMCMLGDQIVGGLGVIDNVVNLLSIKLMKNGHNNGSVSNGGQKCYCPVCGVASTHSYPVSFLNTRCLHHDVKLLNLSCHIMILQGNTLVVGQCIEQPVVLDGFFNIRIETRYVVHCTIFKILCKGNAFPAHLQKKCAIFYRKSEKDNYSDKWKIKSIVHVKNKWKKTLWFVQFLVPLQPIS